jgi:hypothetical protein
VCTIVDRQPYKAKCIFSFICYCVLLNLTAQRLGGRPPTRFIPHAPPLTYHSR